MKKIMFGIALMLFGFMCLYVATQSNWRGVDIVGVMSGIFGLATSITGFCEKEK